MAPQVKKDVSKPPTAPAAKKRVFEPEELSEVTSPSIPAETAHRGFDVFRAAPRKKPKVVLSPPDETASPEGNKAIGQSAEDPEKKGLWHFVGKLFRT